MPTVFPPRRPAISEQREAVLYAVYSGAGYGVPGLATPNGTNFVTAVAAAK